MCPSLALGNSGNMRWVLKPGLCEVNITTDATGLQRNYLAQITKFEITLVIEYCLKQPWSFQSRFKLCNARSTCTEESKDFLHCVMQKQTILQNLFPQYLSLPRNLDITTQREPYIVQKKKLLNILSPLQTQVNINGTVQIFLLCVRKIFKAVSMLHYTDTPGCMMQANSLLRDSK